MLHQIKTYIKHRLLSFHLHGIHSPFIYTLQHQCINDLRQYKAYASIATYYQQINTLPDYNTANQTSLYNAQLIYRLCRYLNTNTVVEVGSSMGLISYAMSLTNPLITVHNIINQLDDYTITQQQLAKHNLAQIHIAQQTISNYMTLNNLNNIDLFYLNNIYDLQPTLDHTQSHTHNDSVWVIPNIHQSPTHTKLWNQNNQHHRVTASINLYHLGLLFVRKEQLQQRFYIKP